MKFMDLCVQTNTVTGRITIQHVFGKTKVMFNVKTSSIKKDIFVKVIRKKMTATETMAKKGSAITLFFQGFIKHCNITNSR